MEGKPTNDALFFSYICFSGLLNSSDMKLDPGFKTFFQDFKSKKGNDKKRNNPIKHFLLLLG